jgi:hypothetical protein
MPAAIYRRQNWNQNCIRADVLIWHLAPKSVVLNIHMSVFSFSIWKMVWTLFMFFCLWYGSLAMKLWPCERDVDAVVPSDAVRCKHKVLYSVQEYQEIKWRVAWLKHKTGSPRKPPCSWRAARTHTTLSSDSVLFLQSSKPVPVHTGAIETWCTEILDWGDTALCKPLGGTVDPFCDPQMVNTSGPQIKCVPCCLYYTRSIGRCWLNEDCQPTWWREWHCSCCQAAALITHYVIWLWLYCYSVCHYSAAYNLHHLIAGEWHQHYITSKRGQMSFWIVTDPLFQHNIMFIFIYVYIFIYKLELISVSVVCDSYNHHPSLSVIHSIDHASDVS